MILRACLAACLLAPAAALHASAGETVAAAVEVTFPEDREQARLTRFALGKEPAAAARHAVLQSLSRAPWDTVDGGSRGLLLALEVISATQQLEDNSGLASRPSSVAVNLLVRWRWSRGGITLHEGEVDQRARRALPEAPTRRDVGETWREALDAAAQRAFVAAVEAGAFQPSGQPGSAGATPASPPPPGAGSPGR